jgi:hypothetical protein
MSEYFRYSTTPANPAMTAPAPLASSKEVFDKMMAAKQVNDGSYWSVMREVFASDFCDQLDVALCALEEFGACA